MRFRIRTRLTAWYTLLLAAILVALAAFLVVRLRADLEATIDHEVRANSVQIARAFSLADPGEASEDFHDVSGNVLAGRGGMARVLDPSGGVVSAYGDAIDPGPIVPAGALEDALAGRQRMLTVVSGVRGERFRAQVSPVQRAGRRRLIVVAESLQAVDESVGRVLMLLWLAVPAALGATALVGWWLARKALRPVERMISQAREIGIDRLDERIAVPRAGDEIARLAVTLNSMLDRLEQGVREKHRLIADASHELRTPLAVMRAELDVSLRADDLTPDAAAALESVREEVDGMSRTVNNLLTLAQVDEGRLELLTSDVRLAEAIEAAVRPLRPLAEGKGLALEVDADGQQARADPHRLHQALTNFIENAIKYGRPGGSVRVTAWRENGEVGVTVSDDGPGIPAAARPLVFDRFYRVDGARGRDGGGSGLGLAICREIATAHGGRVWVDSEESGGSAFSLALPSGDER
jgi:heavy metal sensor kinase